MEKIKAASLSVVEFHTHTVYIENVICILAIIEYVCLGHLANYHEAPGDWKEVAIVSLPGRYMLFYATNMGR